MKKIFWTNILRSVIISAIAFVVTGGINIGVNYFCVGVLHASGAPFWLFGGIATVLSGSIMGVVSKWGKDYEFLFPDIMQPADSEYLKLIKEGKKIKWSQIKASLLPQLFVGIIMIVALVPGLPYAVDISENLPANPILNGCLYLMTAITSLLVTQLGYYIIYKSHYKDSRCDRCGHVLCLVKLGIDSVSSWSERETQEKSESKYREWEWDGKVYGGYGEGSFRTRAVTTKTTYFNCRCAICGNEQLHSEEGEKEYGNWSEWS